MNRKITIGGGIEAVLPTGPYQNQRPSFTIQIELDCDWDDEKIFAYQKELQEKCYANFKVAEQQAIRERIELERKDFHWLTLKSGKLVPSVTSVLNFDADFFMDASLLREYAAQGRLNHKAVSHYIKMLLETGKPVWLPAKELTDLYPDMWTEYVIIKKGQAMLPTDGISFPGFLEKYPMEFGGFDTKVINEEDEYGGTLDFYGTPVKNEKEDILPVITVCDVKRSVDKLKNFMQISAYAKALEKDKGLKVEQMMIVPLSNEKTQQGFSKPVVSRDIDKFYALFLEKRRQFRGRYGI